MLKLPGIAGCIKPPSQSTELKHLISWFAHFFQSFSNCLLTSYSDAILSSFVSILTSQVSRSGLESLLGLDAKYHFYEQIVSSQNFGDDAELVTKQRK